MKKAPASRTRFVIQYTISENTKTWMAEKSWSTKICAIHMAEGLWNA